MITRMVSDLDEVAIMRCRKSWNWGGKGTATCSTPTFPDCFDNLSHCRHHA